MEILFVVATPFESERLAAAIGILPNSERGLFLGSNGELALLVTGIGMVNTARQLSLALARHRPKLVVNLGIAGAFIDGPNMLEVVEVVEECYAELGAESQDGFLSLEQMGFAHAKIGGQDFFNRMAHPAPSQLPIRKVCGITVNKVHGKQESIDAVARQWNPDIETMEGAAVFQCCMEESIPFACIRAISNQVEPRNRANWKVKEAIQAVEEFVIRNFVSSRS